jgi:hypothetical protein
LTLRYDPGMRRLRFALLLASPLLLALLAIGIIGLDTGRAPAPPAGAPPAEPSAQPPSATIPVSAGSVAPTEPTDPLPGTFEGHVLSTATGGAIPDAELTFSRGGVAASVRAGVDGAFLFRPPARGRWLLAAASAPGYFPFAPEWGYSPVQLDAVPGRRVRGLDVFLAPAVPIAGLVVDEDGAPIGGAEVRLLGAGGRASLISIPGRFLTAADGTFRAAAPLGAVLEAHKPGFYPGSARVDLQAMVDGRIRIQLGAAAAGPAPPRGALAGRVVGPDGRPVPGALVEAAKTHGWAYSGTPVAQAVTDADGRFHVGDLARSPHQLTVRADGFVPEVVGRVLPGAAELRITLSAGGRVHGCVRDAGGAPVAPYSIRTYFDTNGFRGDPDLQVSVADPSGCFTLSELRSGVAVVVIVAPGHASSDPVTVDVPAPPQRAELDVTLGAAGTLTGVARDEVTGAPLSSAWVTAEAIPPLADSGVVPVTVVAETSTGLDGFFRLGGLPGRVRIIVNAAGHHPTYAEVNVAPGDVSGPVAVALRPRQEGDAGPVEPVGIGAVLQPEGDGVSIAGLRPGTPAETSGLVPGDEVLEVDGHSVAQLGVGGAVEAMRGPEGTTAYLTVRRGNTTLEVEVPRRKGR